MRAFSLMILLGLTLGSAAEGDRASAAPSQGAAALKIDRSNAGKPMPGASFVDKAGKTVTLARFQGRPTVVNLWATWCAPCKAEMPALDRYAARMKGKVNVVTVAQDIEGWRAVDKFWKPGTFKALTAYLDQPTELALAYKAKGLPVTIGYDAKGRELWRVNGPIEWDDAGAIKQLGL
jgi:thiol-disulfide isomerase/thioredoxin